MNRSKIEWCDHTWNPVTGCRHGCEYCYARTMTRRFSGEPRMNKMAREDYRLEIAEDGSELFILDKEMVGENGQMIVYPFEFEPTFHRYRLNVLDKLKMGNNIFVGAMCDLFGAWVPDSWLDEILKICTDVYPEHNYLFLTKNPSRYISYRIPTGRQNMWYGTTITGPADMGRAASLIIDGKTFVSIEPLREKLSAEDIDTICKVSDWIIIGAETGRRRTKVKPQFDWVKEIVLLADQNGIPVFMKESLVPIVGEENMRREFPQELLSKTLSEKMQNKLYDICNSCGEYEMKRDMLAICARSCRGEQPKQFAFLCKKCFKEQCKKWGIDVPKLRKMED